MPRRTPFASLRNRVSLRYDHGYRGTDAVPFGDRLAAVSLSFLRACGVRAMRRPRMGSVLSRAIASTSGCGLPARHAQICRGSDGRWSRTCACEPAPTVHRRHAGRGFPVGRYSCRDMGTKVGEVRMVQTRPSADGARYRLGPRPVQDPTCGPTQRLSRSRVCANSAPHITSMFKAFARRRSLSRNGR